MGAAPEIRTLNSELERRINDLTEINHELEAFGYSISHDMRAPLRSIRSFSQFLNALRYDKTFDQAVAEGFPGQWRALADVERDWQRSLQ